MRVASRRTITVGSEPVMRVRYADVSSVAGSSVTSSCGEQLARRRAIVRRFCRQCSIAASNAGESVRIDRPRRRRRLLDVLARDLVPVVALERQPAGRGAVERDAERVDVGAAVERLRARLLGREVLRRPDHHVGAGLVRVAADSARAIPKSATTALPCASNRMLSTLMSRWITPSRWAKPRAWATSTPTRTTNSSGSDVRRPRAGRPARTGVVHGEVDGVAIAADRVDLDDVGVAELARPWTLRAGTAPRRSRRRRTAA